MAGSSAAELAQNGSTDAMALPDNTQIQAAPDAPQVLPQ